MHEQEIGSLLDQVDSKVSYKAIHHLRQNKNKHESLVEAGMMGTKKFVAKIGISTADSQIL
jgi:hypothetical protein